MGRVSFHPPTCGLVVMGLRGFDEYLPQPSVADRLGYRCPRRGQAASLLPPWGASGLVVAPVGGKQPRCCPRRGLRGFVGQVPIQGGVADPEVLGYVRAVIVCLHALGCREMLKSSALSAK